MSKRNTQLSEYAPAERKLFAWLNTPAKIQDFINRIPANFELQEETCRSPRETLRHNTAHCMEGALLAAAILEFHGHEPLVMDLRSQKPGDDDHVVAVFRQFGCYGAISKTNHGVLRYREPVYRTIRELALSYFHEYFLDSGKKTLREYTLPVDLNRFNRLHWRTTDKELFEIPWKLDTLRHCQILNPAQIKNLRRADPLEIEMGKLMEWKRGRAY